MAAAATTTHHQVQQVRQQQQSPSSFSLENRTGWQQFRFAQELDVDEIRIVCLRNQISPSVERILQTASAASASTAAAAAGNGHGHGPLLVQQLSRFDSVGLSPFVLNSFFHYKIPPKNHGLPLISQRRDTTRNMPQRWVNPSRNSRVFQVGLSSVVVPLDEDVSHTAELFSWLHIDYIFVDVVDQPLCKSCDNVLYTHPNRCSFSLKLLICLLLSCESIY